MGKCGSKAKKMDANDVPYGMKEKRKRDEIDEDKDCILRQQDDKYLNHVEERTGIVLNIVADKVSIGSSGDILKFKDDMFQNSNINDIKTKVCKQEPLKEIYMATDECTDGPIVTSSKALNFKEPFNAEKEINKLCKEETEISELICTKHDLADTKSNNEPSKTDERASSCQTMTEKPTTGSTLQKQTGTSSSHGSSTGSLEQDGSTLNLSHLLSEGSNDSTIHCDINRCCSATNDVDKLKDYAIVSKRSDFESSTTSSQLFRPMMTSTEGLLRSSENSPFTEQLDRTCHASNKQQMYIANKTPLSSSVQVFKKINTNSDENMSPVTPRVVEQQLASSHYTPSNNELTNMSDITPGTSSNVPENDGTVEEKQIQSTNQSSVTQAGEDQGEEHQEQENQAEEDLTVEIDSEPVINDGISVGNNKDLNDQQLKEKGASCDVMKTIYRLADVGQYSMDKNYDIAMTGNDEVKIENGKVIGSTAGSVSSAMRDIAIESIKAQKNF